VWSELLIATGLGRRLLSPSYPHPRRPLRREPYEVDWINGCFMLLRRSAVERVGGMDEEYWIYSEDTDWCFRLRGAGWRIVYLPQIEAVHEGAASTRQVKEEMILQLNRSKLLFFAKHRGAAPTRRLRLLLGAVYAARAALYRILARGSDAERWRRSARIAGAVAAVYRSPAGEAR
jgi:GT2 family glycosyltransferase